MAYGSCCIRINPRPPRALSFVHAEGSFPSLYEKLWMRQLISRALDRRMFLDDLAKEKF